MAKWPGIDDKKHESKSVKPGIVVVHHDVEANALRPGDKIVEQENERGRVTRYAKVNSVRRTRRNTSIIVNGYLVYPFRGTVRLITQMYENAPETV